jgi:RNA polymerase sigma factor (sigma-70 family)
MARMSKAAQTKRKRYMVAMVLGTALSALGTGAALAETPTSTLRAVADMSRYCTTCWRNARLSPDSWGDCTQEVLSRMLERVTPEAWDRVLQSDGEEHREFIRAIDTVKKRNQRQRRWASTPLESVADRNELSERRLAEDREVVRQAATELLSPRQQHILQLSLEGWSVHEIAGQLKIGPERVSDEKYKAIRKLRDHLAS